MASLILATVGLLGALLALPGVVIAAGALRGFVWLWDAPSAAQAPSRPPSLPRTFTSKRTPSLDVGETAGRPC